VIAGVPILVRDPVGYLRSELGSLDHAFLDAERRKKWLEKVGRELELPNITLDRHRDVADVQSARLEMFRSLLEPARKVLETLGDAPGESPGVRRKGWTLESLIPYLLRDWTNTSELETTTSLVGDAVKRQFPDVSAKSLAFAACGAGGLLKNLSTGFARVFGFDLTLPVLVAARHLLDGETLELAMPRSSSETGSISLRGRQALPSDPQIELLAMDVFHTAFPDESIDCLVTAYLIDLVPDPRRLAAEIWRILSVGGIWINFGPSGRQDALWRFDQPETRAIFEAAGFGIEQSEAHRSTLLDLSRDIPSWNFRNEICYLTTAKKTGRSIRSKKIAPPTAADSSKIIPQHFPGAYLIERQSLGQDRTCTLVYRYENIPSHVENVEVGTDTAQILELVDGQRSVGEIVRILEQSEPVRHADETLHAFASYFAQGLLTWRVRGQ